MNFIYLLLVSLFLSTASYGNNYSTCILENMKDVTSDAAAKAIQDACKQLYPVIVEEKKEKVCKNKWVENYDFKFSKLEKEVVRNPYNNLSTLFTPETIKRKCKLPLSGYSLDGFNMCEDIAAVRRYITFTNTGSKENLACFRYKQKGGEWITHNNNCTKVKRGQTEVFKIYETDFNIPNIYQYSFEGYYIDKVCE